MEDVQKKSWLSPRKALIMIALLAFVMRLLAVLTRPMLQLDETIYARMAENLINGQGFVDLTGNATAHFSPLFPAIIAAVSMIFRDYAIAGYAVVIVFGTLIVIPTYLLGRELIGERVGLMAAALIAVIPLFVDYSSRLYSESVYIFFLMMALFFAWQMLGKRRLPCAAMAGLSLGLAYLVNPSTVFYIFLIVGLAVVVSLKQRAFKQMLKPLVLFLAVFSIFALPYITFIHNVTGKWTYTGKESYEQVFTATHNLRYGTLEWEKQASALTDDGRESWMARAESGDDIVSYLALHPKQAIKIFVNQSNVFYTEQLARVMPLWLLMLLGLGLFARDWDRRRAAAVGFIFLMMSPALIILAMYATDRFFMPFVPPALILVAIGWRKLEQWGIETISLSLRGPRRELWRKLVPWLIGFAVLAPVILFTFGGLLGTSYDMQYREAGEWIKQEAGSGKIVMGRWESSSSYYSGGVSIGLPYADYDHLTTFARSRGVDYIVLGRQAIYDFRPELVRLLDDSSEHPEWKLVKTIRPGSDQETLIFQLVKD